LRLGSKTIRPYLCRFELARGETVVTMRLDADLLAWFRQQRGYQTRINAILRAYMKARMRPRDHG
jgi:uncharacterized protein (DUF4415 family)